ncbi:MAG: hypothetical protein ACJA0J_002391, partial [Bdellovibrionota bacterium]
PENRRDIYHDPGFQQYAAQRERLMGKP